jgi:hypothetical protein
MEEGDNKIIIIQTIIIKVLATTNPKLNNKNKYKKKPMTNKLIWELIIIVEADVLMVSQQFK